MVGSFAAVAIRNAGLFNDLMAHMGLYTIGSVSELAKTISAAPRLEDLSVLFADMRGFTQLLQSVADPLHVRRIVDEFLELVSMAVLRNGGARSHRPARRRHRVRARPRPR